MTSSTNPPSSDTSSTSSTPPSSVTPSTQAGVPSGVSVPDDVLDAALQQAAEDTGMSPDEFDVVGAAQVTWNDGSLGCPQPGRMYTQALVEGYWVILANEGETFDYRSSMNAEFSRCMDGRPPFASNSDR